MPLPSPSSPHTYPFLFQYTDMEKHTAGRNNEVAVLPEFYNVKKQLPSIATEVNHCLKRCFHAFIFRFSKVSHLTKLHAFTWNTQALSSSAFIPKYSLFHPIETLLTLLTEQGPGANKNTTTGSADISSHCSNNPKFALLFRAHEAPQ